MTIVNQYKFTIKKYINIINFLEAFTATFDNICFYDHVFKTMQFLRKYSAVKSVNRVNPEYEAVTQSHSAVAWKDISQYVHDSVSNVSHLPTVNNRV